MDYENRFHHVLKPTRSALDVETGWTALVRELERLGGEPLPTLHAVDVAADVKHVRRQIERVTRAEPT